MTAIKDEMDRLRIADPGFAKGFAEASCGLRIGRRDAAPLRRSIGNRKSEIGNFRAFTLIELLVVISIIAVIAAFLLPVAGAVRKQSMIRTAQAEMAQLETAIDRYKSAYGFYPPSNGNTANYLTNQLYFELLGTTNNNGTYQTLDGSAKISGGDANSTFGVSGFMNCSKTNADESTPQARDFLPDLKPNQIATYTNGTDVVKVLITSVGGPDAAYQPLGGLDLNPWRYNSSSPTNNPGSYDLWVQLSIGGKTNLICNWSKQVQINNPLP
ncbi:MAG: type II secretion system protein [Limisphaerales bacterium]